MGSTTTNLGLYKPDISETGWGTLVNNNFDILEGDNLASVMYVRPTGSNSNSGRNWAVAKKDILGAYDALPAAGGTIYFEDGSYVDAVNTTRGFWIVGGNDPNYASPPTGFRQEKPVHIEGVKMTSAGAQDRTPVAGLHAGSTTDTTLPGIWLTGVHGPVSFENINLGTLAQPVLLGKSSTGATATETCGIRFDNCRQRVNPIAGLGPCVDIYAAFWVWWSQCTFSSNEAEAATSDKRANILIRGNSIGEGLYYMDACELNGGGGVKHNAGTSCGFDMTNTTQEGSTTLGAGGAPIYLLFGVLARAGLGVISVRNCESADRNTSADVAVRVSAGNRPGRVVVEAVQDWAGPVLALGTYPNTNNNLTTTLLQDGGFGLYGGRAYAQQDSSRRAFGPALARYVNKAADDVTTWGAKPGSATVTTGQTGPDGLTNAAELTSGAFNERHVARFNQTVAVGDWFLGGVWAKVGDPTVGPPDSPVSVSTAASNNLFTTGASSVGTTVPFTLEGSWQWVWAAAKLATVGTAATEAIMALRCDLNKPMYYYAPVFWYIPTGTVTDGEVYELANHMQQYSNTASAGQVALMRDQHLHIPKGYIEIGNMTAPSAPTASSGFARLYIDTSGGKQRVMALFDSGVAQVIATEP